MTIKRRQFIQSAAVAGALAGAPAIHAKRNKAKRYRTALIGSGWWGMNILKEARKRVEEERKRVEED
mgnify:CR=1 FL=1